MPGRCENEIIGENQTIGRFSRNAPSALPATGSGASAPAAVASHNRPSVLGRESRAGGRRAPSLRMSRSDDLPGLMFGTEMDGPTGDGNDQE